MVPYRKIAIHTYYSVLRNKVVTPIELIAELILKVQILKRGSGNRDASQDFAKSELLKLLLTKV